ncbi:DUF4333 domain-containing protein [Mumia sp. ZJ1417]|uniref:DUF4333 domain-containing protein n=1 Tax=Mumia sp. ZJ1417 TaxID=2708082 RepID=UPI00141DDB2E|nr:DUF4333 domain-containing protein [Mumia sp. ZJ1417]QMW67307.1 DUF4333 domain-containing protein [Mumia sp. ZJ1417]
MSTPALRHRSRLALSALAVALGLTLSACGGGAVKASDVEKEAEKALGAQVGVTPEITCPDDLEATKGATLRCELRVSGDNTVYGVTVTAESVEGSTVGMGFKVDEQPAS